MDSVGLKQFRVSTAGTLLSYCVYDPRSRDAILIDPHFDAIDEYAEFISSNRLKPLFVIETQIHWSHPSAYQNLKSRYPGLSSPKFRDQETIAIGAFQFQVLSTPGVSRDAIVVSGERLLFTGNTLWIGSCGPGGFPDSSATEHFQSLKRIVELVDSLILPGFDSNDLIFSTLEVEKKKNLALQKLGSEQDFIRWSRERSVVPDDLFKKIYEGNAKGVESDQRFSRLESVFRTTGRFPEDNGDFGLSIGAINPEKYASKLKEHASSNAFLDVREREEFSAGHMPGVENVPWIEVGFHLMELKAKKRIYVSCLSGRRSTWVSRTLAYLDFADVVNVSGGFSAWLNAGLTVEVEKGTP
jgi:glyoxylase-like metal-dependent hydrolase (beta-lactamase superfamily II)/rhodanese-related sulfurtransferase